MRYLSSTYMYILAYTWLSSTQIVLPVNSLSGCPSSPNSSTDEIHNTPQPLFIAPTTPSELIWLLVVIRTLRYGSMKNQCTVSSSLVRLERLNWFIIIHKSSTPQQKYYILCSYSFDELYLWKWMWRWIGE